MITSPASGSSLSSLAQTFSGVCSAGVTINATYTSNATGAASLPCNNGEFSLPVTISAITGTYTVTLSQTDTLGLSTQASSSVSFTHSAMNQATGFDAAVSTVLLNSDGTLFAGGAFTSYSGTAAQGIAKLSSAGALASDFTSTSGFAGTVYALAASSTGTLYVGGSFTSYDGNGAANIASLTSAGIFNPSFVMGTGFDFAVNAVVMAPDTSGDIYVGGQFGDYNGTAVGKIARLTNLGAINGTFAPASGFNGTVNAIAIANDGSQDVLVGGAFTTFDGAGAVRIARLNSVGGASGAFSSGAGFNGTVNAILPVTDGTGDYYVGGAFTQYDGNPCNGIARISPTGTFITSFAMGTGFDTTVYSLAEASDTSGDIFAGGTFTTYDGVSAPGLVRLRATGSADVSLAIGAGFNAKTASIAVGSDGSLYVGGSFVSFNTSGVNYLAKLNSTGTLQTYNSGTGFNGAVNAISPTADSTGDIYVGGAFTYYRGTAVARLAKLTLSGAQRSTFSIGTGFDGDVLAIAAAPDTSGDIFVGGSFTHYDGVAVGRIVRLTSTGALNSAFVQGTGFDASVRAILPVADGSTDLYVGGDFAAYGASTPTRIARLQMDGTFVASFATGTGFDGSVRSLVVTDDSGLVWVGGDFQNYNGSGSNRIAVLDPDGTANASFTVGTGFDASVQSLASSGDGSGEVYVGGLFTDYDGTTLGHITRLQPSGSISTVFTGGTGLDASVYALATAADGSGDIFAAGGFLAYQGSSVKSIVRLAASGTRQTAFTLSSAFSSTPLTIVPATDGSGEIYFGGNFHSVNSSAVDGLARLTTSATVD